MTENGVPYKLKINSTKSDLWINEGLEKNTLVRLSGLPNQIVPSIGVKDSFGDWLFTWSDLVKNKNIINLFADPYWRGIASFSLFITQLRSDASLINSPIKTFGLEVIPVANKPILILNEGVIEEDSKISLNQLINRSRLIDNDGSEELFIELQSQNNKFYLTRDLNDLNEIIPSSNNLYKFKYEDINNIFINPKLNFLAQSRLIGRLFQRKLVMVQKPL